MFWKNTVLILGAGASMPYGYPSGEGLVNAILNTPDTDIIIRRRGEAGFGDGTVQYFRQKLRRAGGCTIDEFLEWNAEFRDLGGFLIAEQLLANENEDALFETRQDAWYHKLVKAIAPRPNAVDCNRLAIITFNYDRSLEQYLTVALTNRFQNWSIDRAAEALERIPILHVHGQLGLLPWQSGSANRFKYNSELSAARLKDAANSIALIHESRHDNEIFQHAQRLIRESEYIFCLGFAYHDTNMAHLQFPPCHPNQKTNDHYCIEGTCYGLSEAQRAIIIADYPNAISLGSVNHKIHHFMDENIAWLRASSSERTPRGRP
jgi:hypothetical protein